MFVDEITLKRFWDKVNKTDGCWLWTASTRNKGYGAFCWHENGVMIQGRAHVFSYRIHNGDIPTGIFVLHKCDTPACVNPDHLCLGTKAVNNQDMVEKKRDNPGGYKTGTNIKNTGDSHWNYHLPYDRVLQMRMMREKQGLPYTILSRIFGVSVTTVGRIINNKSRTRGR